MIHLEQLEQRIHEIVDDREKTIVAICRTDYKSEKAVKILSKNDFSNIYIAKMGMTDWIKHGYTTE